MTVFGVILLSSTTESPFLFIVIGVFTTSVWGYPSSTFMSDHLNTLTGKDSSPNGTLIIVYDKSKPNSNNKNTLRRRIIVNKHCDPH